MLVKRFLAHKRALKTRTAQLIAAKLNKVSISMSTFRYLCQVARLANTTVETAANVLVARGVLRDVEKLPAKLRKSLAVGKVLA